MNFSEVYKKALNLEPINFDEAIELYLKAPTSELTAIAHEIRTKQKNDEKNVGWIIDRNVNITNICISQCKFCNFYRTKKSHDAFVTTYEQYFEKIEQMYALGGRQLLLQGGLNPDLDLDYYTNLFKTLKSKYPWLKLHALSPTEIVFLSKKNNLPYRKVLEKLIDAGLDSLPGAGAEILVERVRKIISPAKCTAQQWLDVMREAHLLNLPTSATMMFGTIETKKERIEHLFRIRDLQAQKPDKHYGFITFVPWPFQSKNTKLQKQFPFIRPVLPDEYIRLVAIARIILYNIKNIQASWLTVGYETAQFSLWSGANDFGSIMIEENVVSSAGANFKLNSKEIQDKIKEAGFIPRLRNQKYEFID